MKLLFKFMLRFEYVIGVLHTEWSFYLIFFSYWNLSIGKGWRFKFNYTKFKYKLLLLEHL